MSTEYYFIRLYNLKKEKHVTHTCTKLKVYLTIKNVNYTIENPLQLMQSQQTHIKSFKLDYREILIYYEIVIQGSRFNEKYSLLRFAKYQCNFK